LFRHPVYVATAWFSTTRATAPAATAMLAITTVGATLSSMALTGSAAGAEALAQVRFDQQLSVKE